MWWHLCMLKLPTLSNTSCLTSPQPPTVCVVAAKYIGQSRIRWHPSAAKRTECSGSWRLKWASQLKDAHTPRKKVTLLFARKCSFLLFASFCLYSQPTLTPLARLIFVKCVQQRAEAPLRNTNGAQINLFPVADFLWLVWDPARRWCRLQTLPDWLTAGICQRWQVQTAVWQPQLMNNEWVETRRPGESISPLDSFHHSYIPESAKTP